MKLFTALFLVCSIFTLSEGRAQELVRGVVFDDINKNGLFDNTENGIKDVSVSNGKDVVQTGDNGEFQISIQKTSTIFVIKPGGYSYPTSQYNLPNYYYQYYPDGSPKLKYSGVQQTGKLKDKLFFPLIKRNSTDEFKILVFGDSQTKDKQELGYFRRGIVEEVESIKGVEFGLTLGDIVYDDLELYDDYKQIISRIGVPWFNVIGNHDINIDAKEDRFSNDTFEANFGPSTYAFNHGKVHFIVLDDILYPDPRGKWHYYGGLTEEQLEFVENDLRYVPNDFLVVLSMHIPFIENMWGDTYRDEDRNRLFELLNDYPHTLSLSAHTHIQQQIFMDSTDGWLQEKPHHHYNVGTSCGDWYSGFFNEKKVPISTMRDGTRKGYAFINFKGNDYSIEYKVAGESESYQFEIYCPKIMRIQENNSYEIAANYFMGNSNDILFFRIDNGEWKKMKRTKTFDPSYYHEVQKWDYIDKLPNGIRPSNPIACNHLWMSDLPNDLYVGNHILEVKTKNRYGKVLKQKKQFKVVE